MNKSVERSVEEIVKAYSHVGTIKIVEELRKEREALLDSLGATRERLQLSMQPPSSLARASVSYADTRDEALRRKQEQIHEIDRILNATSRELEQILDTYRRRY